MFKAVFIFSLIALAFSQVSTNIYGDSACTKVSGGIFYKSTCVNKKKVSCSSDGKNVFQSSYANNDCTGTATASVTLGEVGKGTSLLGGFGKFVCGSSAITRSKVVSTTTVGGCLSNSLFFGYAYTGCYETLDGFSEKVECSGNKATTTKYSDNACSKNPVASVADTNVCSLNITETSCGVVGLESSAFQITIGLFIISFVICFWF